MSTRYISAEPLTMVRIGSDETATIAYVFQGAPVPEGADPDDVKRLVDEGFLVEQEVADSDTEGKPSSVKEILATVGDDKGLAQQYLDEENAAERPRPSLVEKLQAVLDAE